MKIGYLAIFVILLGSCGESKSSKEPNSLPLPEIVEFSTAQTTLELAPDEYQEVVVRWRTNNAAACTIARDLPAELVPVTPAAAGERSYAIDRNTGLTLICKNFAEQEVRAEIKLVVNRKSSGIEQPPAPKVSITVLKAEPSVLTLIPGSSGSSKITWSTENAVSCLLKQGEQELNVDPKKISGESAVTVSVSTIVTLICKNEDGMESTENVRINVIAEEPRLQFCNTIVVAPQVGEAATLYDFFDRPLQASKPRDLILPRRVFNDRYSVGDDFNNTSYLHAADVLDTCDKTQNLDFALLTVLETQFIKSFADISSSCKINPGTILSYEQFSTRQDASAWADIKLKEPLAACPDQGTEGLITLGTFISGTAFVGYPTAATRKIAEIQANPPRIVEFASTKTTVEFVDSGKVTVNWTSEKIESCSLTIPQLNQTEIKNLPTQGSQEISMDRAITVQLKCTDINGRVANQSLDIGIKRLGPYITSFAADVTEINALPSTGAPVTLTFAAENVDSCEITQVGVPGSTKIKFQNAGNNGGIASNVSATTGNFNLVCYQGGKASPTVTLSLPFVNVCRKDGSYIYYKGQSIYGGGKYYDEMVKSGACLKHRGSLDSSYIRLDGQSSFYISNDEKKFTSFIALAKAGAFAEHNWTVRSDSIYKNNNEAFYFSNDEVRVNAFLRLAEVGAFKADRSSFSSGDIRLDGKMVVYYSDYSKRLEAFLKLYKAGIFGTNTLKVDYSSIYIKGEFTFSISDNQERIEALTLLGTSLALSEQTLCRTTYSGFYNRGRYHSLESGLAGVKSYVAYLQSNPFCNTPD